MVRLMVTGDRSVDTARCFGLNPQGRINTQGLRMRNKCYN